MLPRRPSLLLAVAIALEVTGTLCLRASDGFAHPAWTVAVVAAYGTSMFVFARALSAGLPLGVGYSTLTGVGLACATLASLALFHEPLSGPGVVGMVLLVVGVVALQWRPGAVAG
ncbi:hypothetical protein ASG49_07935 [Marmoricola sp. Leaf446]|uniref:DMT family transporter n=1 Tax=Marmoricola sp. Leaf446 TaxID=1736379 RepID=UPI0006F269A1|nr:SMR family transporter [Marmoricola sp. Leaf446]KQT94739.1 hypothetical protein ASG49_07935 [Marmoricola sp. Leaf446]